MNLGLHMTAGLWCAALAGIGLAATLAVPILRLYRRLDVARPLRHIATVLSIGLVGFLSILASLGAYLALESPDRHFSRNFDRTIVGVPVIGRWIAQDPELRQAIFNITRTAYRDGGWPAADWALHVAMSSFALVYADDDHLIALHAADLRLMYRLLEVSPLACRQRMASRFSDESIPPGLRGEHAELVAAYHEALASARLHWFDEASRWKPPSSEVEHWILEFTRYYPTPLTAAEARALKTGRDNALACAARIKIMENTLHLPRDQIGEAIRVEKWGTRLASWSAKRLPGAIFACAKAATPMEKAICSDKLELDLERIE